MKVFLLSIIAISVVVTALFLPLLSVSISGMGHLDTCANSLSSNLLCHTDRTGLYSFLLLLSLMFYFVLSYFIKPTVALSYIRSLDDQNPESFSTFLSKRKTRRWLSRNENSPSL